MIETRARVLSVRDGMAWVEASTEGGCGLCGGGTSGGCGAAGIARLFQWRRRTGYCVGNAVAARPGELVMVGTEDGVLLHAAMRAYGIPLLALLAGAFAGSHFGADVHAALGGLGGLALSLLIRGNNARAIPVIIRRLDGMAPGDQEVCGYSKGGSCGK